MMNNKDNYKKAIDQIHASDSLKEKAFQNSRKNKRVNYTYIKYLSACAVFLIVFVLGTIYIYEDRHIDIAIDDNNEEEIVVAKIDLPKFKNMQELKDVLQNDDLRDEWGVLQKSTTSAGLAETDKEDVVLNDLANTRSKLSGDYSTTNVQVDNVDEADSVKTDGEYIYYVSNNKVYIVDAKSLEISSEIYNITEKESFFAREIFINGNKLVVFGNYSKYRGAEENTKSRYSYEVITKSFAKAIIYDISNKQEPKQLREIELDGNYINSRMIGDNIYFISRKSAYYYDGVKDEELLPAVRDSKYNSKVIKCEDIVYFSQTQYSNFILIGGFNLNNDEEVNVETFFGASDTIYASDKNLYLTQNIYFDSEGNMNTKNVIYKFSLSNSHVVAYAKTEIPGGINNQFSMDEYDGNLRIATTTDDGNTTSNHLFILDDNLEKIGELTDLAKDEKIYSVRFKGKIGYIVTFKQVDPLFVLDLSDPTAPVVKGELKIPGYSSYLHPYDETHIIGIGYNTKDNGYGGITNSSMKMSMFDVSDLENPKEMFSVNIGNDYAYSDIMHDHKALFYKKSENLIGFPICYREYRASDDKNGFILFRINLENNEFEKYGEILEKIDYLTNIQRAIYIDNTLYTLSNSKIVSYNLETLDKLKEVELKIEDNPHYYSEVKCIVEDLVEE